MNLVRQLYDLLEARERWQLMGLGACMLVMALFETVGVASILPFMRAVSKPEVVHQNHWLSWAYDRFRFSSIHSFLMFLGLAVLAVITANNAFSAFTTWLMNRFAWAQNHRLSMRLLARYLDRPYSFYLSRNTSGLNKTILAEVQTVIQGVMLSSLRFVSALLVSLLLIGLLAAVNLRLALIIGLVLGGAYSGVYVFFRRKHRQLGRVRLYENGQRFRVSAEALAGIKDLKVLGREQDFLKRFKEPSWRFSKASASNQLVMAIPRYAVETIAFGGVLLIILYFLRYSDVNEMLPTLTLYVFGGYRLMPSLNTIFSSGLKLRFDHAALDDLHTDLLKGEFERDGRKRRPLNRLPLRSGITSSNLSFTYPNATVPSLVGLNLTIRRNEVVGLVGETGAGKTTLVDLILGLLVPTTGILAVDEIELKGESRFAWRLSCGYIPQQIFLSDDTIRSNIAFGVPRDSIDDDAIVRAARIAQIHDFVSSLPKGYETTVGERGVRLSGGQRQRIGIARALYHDPDVLVMDEATSALDGATEAAVMDMIHGLGRTKTLIVIAHRLSTVRACDTIYLLHSGGIIANGTYEDLSRNNPQFRTMAGLEKVQTP